MTMTCCSSRNPDLLGVQILACIGCVLCSMAAAWFSISILVMNAVGVVVFFIPCCMAIQKWWKAIMAICGLVNAFYTPLEAFRYFDYNNSDPLEEQEQGIGEHVFMYFPLAGAGFWLLALVCLAQSAKQTAEKARITPTTVEMEVPTTATIDLSASEQTIEETETNEGAIEEARTDNND